MKSKYISLIVLSAVIVVAFVLGACVLITPASKADLNAFSAENAAEHLKAISEKPHSVFDRDAHENVRGYIIETMEGFGIETEEHKYINGSWEADGLEFMGALDENGMLDKTKPFEYDVTNVWAKIPGKSDNGMLFMAHYDSRGHKSADGIQGGSYGAADDGYGVVTLLEIARLYADRTDLENSLYFCFTDAEETGMIGSTLEAHYNETIINNVNFVVNVEARGVRGPAFMFETSARNDKVMQLYSKSSMPVTYSVATAVYSVMTNYTDFTAMLDIDKAGVNFSTLDNINYYHVPEDNFSNISKSSIQHYGSQILPMIEEYTSDAKYGEPDYFDGNSDSVFFNLFPGVLVMYSSATAITFTVIGALLYAAAVFFMYRTGKLNVKRMFISLAIVFGTLIGSAIIGLIMSLLTALFSGNPFNLTGLYAKGAGVPFALSLIIALALELLLCIKKFGKDKSLITDVMTAAVGLNTLLSILTTFTLTGASFLFFWPALFGSAAMLVYALTRNFAARHVLFSLTNAVCLLFYVPLLYSLFLAITVGGLVALNLLFAIAASVVLPISFLQLSLRTKKDAQEAQNKLLE